MIDTHAHIYAEQFTEELPSIIQRAKAIGITNVLLPNIDVDSIEGLNALVELDSPFFKRMMGLHPCSVQEDYKDQLAIIKSQLDTQECVAVGEIGIDLYWDKTTKSWQEDAFIQQVEFAISKHLPLAIHSRSATHELIQLLKPFKGKVTGVFHCFSESAELANEIIKLDFLLGIGGVITFKNAGLSQALENVDLKHIILETDSPYLAPVPYRGKRNEPSYTRLIADKLAEAKGISAVEVYEITSDNAERLFFGH